MPELVAWQSKDGRKPLLLQGVRQCGKTWLLKEFGHRHFEATAYVNFDENPEYAEFFAVKDPDQITRNLSWVVGQPIEDGRTLLVLDEIQGCPAALNSLKYFREKRPRLHVAAAGSLLGVALAGSGFPVGQVDFLTLGPLTFLEFLRADPDGALAEYAESITDLGPVPEVFLNRLAEQLKYYLAVGGMPEPVSLWVERHDVAAADESLGAILRAYELDFAKHAKPTDFPKISLIWGSLPSQLSRENKKFLYQTVKPGARAREYEDALQWLVRAELVAKIHRVTAPRLPLSAYDDLSAFKLFAVDVGLLRKLSRLSTTTLLEGDRLFTEFRGALSENYVLQALRPQYEVTPRYWSRSNPACDVDFLVQHDNEVLPVEVKSGASVSSRSLANYSARYPKETPLRIRFSSQNLRLDGDLLNIPLGLASQARRLIALALQRA
jgi:predicted AAA+ superfamily ATPase